MGIAPHLLEADELGKAATLRRLDLPVVLAQLGWNPHQVESRVDLFLFRGQDQLAGLDLLEALLGK